MRFYTQQHPFYCGIDLHARTMYVCILSQDGEVVLHRNMKAAPEPFLKAIAPYRDDIVVAVECTFHRISWCRCASLPIVLIFQCVVFIVTHSLTRPDEMEMTHGQCCQSDTPKPYPHRRLPR